MTSSAPRVEARTLTRELPGPVPVTLVRDIDLVVEPGEFVAVTGPSGSGKSSLLYLLGLLDAPTGGSVLIQGEETSGLSPDQWAAIRLARIGFVFQFHFLLPEFSCLANVEIPIRRLGRLSTAQARERAAMLLDSMELADHAGKLPEQLSGGQRQRVAIARALANDPPLILADEPTGNLDTRTAHMVFDLFGKLAREQGRSIVVVTHDSDLAQLADRRIHLVDGRIVP
ncbi:ABC transporter ATP-binding protein [Paramagnetospirillum kuznetsovii]|uniref:ABC transporter ATP-binding protein n=1 Tax=Paramagnetospirillum kuznetsovii TaxID=2053833 RepID=A0A364NWA2_9PROT|nr:ABC transporter ATP-binding protein [Paramagnetospirillum kuznetsovii]RAU21361.1 ABC transporter ATP-binding protein [Paramagnetospirillum kuznetsovii]